MKNKLSKMILTVMACCLTFTTFVTPVLATSPHDNITAYSSDINHYSLSVEEGNENEYAVYQLVTADVIENGLVNFKWGLNGFGNEDNSLEVPSEIIDTLSTLANSGQGLKNEEISGLLNENERFGFLSAESPMNISAGYYLINIIDDSWRILEIKGDYVIATEDNGEKDEGEVIPSNSDEEIPINPDNSEQKESDNTDKPPVDTESSKVEDVKTPVMGIRVKQGDDKFSKAVDAGVGDEITFELTGTFPSDFDLYQNYYYKFENVLPEGLTYVDDSVKIIAGIIFEKEDFNVFYDKNVLSIEIPDLRNVECVNSKGIISVTYKAKLNEKIGIGADGVNKNITKIYFSDKGLMTTEDFYAVARGEMEVPVNVTKESAEANVYSYQLVVRNVDKDGNGEGLEGGGFVLKKKVGDDEWKSIGEEVIGIGENGNEYVWHGIDSGEYRLTQTKVPHGYSGIKPAEFIADANIDEDGLLKGLGVGAHVESGLSEHSASPSDGMIEGKIGNGKIVTLPKTGKMDIVVLYGGVMMLFGVAMILRKKTNQDI